jgi:acid phosphatase type 7
MLLLAVFTALIISTAMWAGCSSGTMGSAVDRQPDHWHGETVADAGDPSSQLDGAMDVARDEDAGEPGDVQSADIGIDADVGDGAMEDSGLDVEPRVYTLAVIADLNESYGSTYHRQPVHDAVRWLVEQIDPDIVISTGDMVAGQRADLDYRAMWRAFHEAVTHPITAAGIPLAVSPGNHDASGYAAFAHERAIFVDEWTTHRPPIHFLDDTNYPLHYAFEVGPALFISLDATRVGPLDTSQRQWVANILETYKDHPLKFVYGHIPLFPVAQGRETEILRDFTLEQLLNDYGVQMMISGHHHAYYPARRGALQLMHTPCLGAGPRALIGESQVSERSVILIQYDATGILSSEAYGGSDFQRIIERRTLPESLNTGELLLYRDDL